jgi:hypothetical protein
MKLPRFTVRHLLGMVALAAIILGLVARMVQRSARFDGLRREHLMKSFEIAYRGGPWSAKEIYVRHEQDLIAKYERAARYPWLSVEPDPPGPE